MAAPTSTREGSLEAPTRHPLGWEKPEFWDKEALHAEMERVFDICHGCRRCVNLCNAFPTLFDLVDESETMEVDGVAKEDYWKVVEHCYLCDLCYMTKCPYVPPHEWNVDFPHLMLRGKAVRFKEQGARARDRILTSTDAVGKLAGIPIVNQVVNAANRNATLRKALEKVLGVHHEAVVPTYHSRTLRKRLGGHRPNRAPEPTEDTTGRVALYATCYGNYNAPQLGEDLVAVFEHNGIPVALVEKERCCGMPKLEIGDLDAVRAAKEANIPVLARMIDEGYDIVAPVPSCVLMYKQELPLMFPDDPQVQKVKAHIFDPFEYLWLRHKAGKLRTDFKQPLGKVTYHAACHMRVQNVGLKTKDLLSLVPETQIQVVERCSGHDGTYGVKVETIGAAQKIRRPVLRQVERMAPDHIGSDCPIAATWIANGVGRQGEHPLSLLRIAYGI